MIKVKHPYIIRKLFPSLTWNIPGKDKKIYITFDDGPTPEVTPWVLSVLKEYNAKATFFCTGMNAEKFPEMIQKIKEEGHSIGNHSYSHLNGWKSKNRKYINDIEQAGYFIDSKLYRPPYGKIRPSQIRLLKKRYKIVIWDVLSLDFDKETSPEKCLKNVISHSKQGSIIVFHDSQKAFKNMSYCLPKILDHFSKIDYDFCAID